MHYQISLTINTVKKLLLETQDLNKDHKSASPTRNKNSSYKTLSRTNSIAKTKIPEVSINNWMIPSKKTLSRKESPVIPHVQLLLTQKISKLSSLNSTQSNEIMSDNRKHLRSNSSAVMVSKNIKKLIQESFENFKLRHQTFATKNSHRPKLLKKHDQFISNLRTSLFSTGFIKSAIFKAWKGLIKRKINVEDNII